MYRVVRVNTENHPTRAIALRDMATIIERGFYWKKSNTVDIPVGTLLIAEGCHGGQGLFIIGICSGKWGKETDAGSYHYRIPVVWQPVVYERHPISDFQQGLSRFNVRFGADCTQGEFRRALDWVLNGDAIDPWQEVAA